MILVTYSNAFEPVSLVARRTRPVTHLYNFNDPNTRRVHPNYGANSNEWWKSSPSSTRTQQSTTAAQRRRATQADKQQNLVRDLSDFRSKQRATTQPAASPPPPQQQRRYQQQPPARPSSTGRQQAGPDTPWKRSASFPRTTSEDPYQQPSRRTPYPSTASTDYNTTPQPIMDQPGRRSMYQQPTPPRRQPRQPRQIQQEQQHPETGMVRQRRHPRNRYPPNVGSHSDYMQYGEDYYNNEYEESTPQDEVNDEVSLKHEAEMKALKNQVENTTKQQETLLQSLLEVQDDLNRAVRMASTEVENAKAASSTEQAKGVSSSNDDSAFPSSSFYFNPTNQWNNATGNVSSSPSSLSAEAMTTAAYTATLTGKPLIVEDQKEKEEEEPKKDTTSLSLDTLLNGITITQSTLSKVLENGGLEKFGEEGEEFDPHFHTALYGFADPTKTPGTIGQVITDGYRMKIPNTNGGEPEYKILRYAEVSVIKE